jgi:hypothetical protein
MNAAGFIVLIPSQVTNVKDAEMCIYVKNDSPTCFSPEISPTCIIIAIIHPLQRTNKRNMLIYD